MHEGSYGAVMEQLTVDRQAACGTLARMHGAWNELASQFSPPCCMHDERMRLPCLLHAVQMSKGCKGGFVCAVDACAGAELSGRSACMFIVMTVIARACKHATQLHHVLCFNGLGMPMPCMPCMLSWEFNAAMRVACKRCWAAIHADLNNRIDNNCDCDTKHACLRSFSLKDYLPAPIGDDADFCAVVCISVSP